MVWNGMEDGMEISVRNMENTRLEWNISKIEWKAIFHTSIPILC